MGYLAVTIAALVLFAGFLLLTRYEARRGVRLLAPSRARLDAHALRAQFILTHVDFESFTREQFSTLMAHIAHDVVHLSLLTVRAIERLLTRLVKTLRMRHGIETATSAAPRAFVKTMSDFKQHLATTRPPIPEI